MFKHNGILFSSVESEIVICCKMDETGHVESNTDRKNVKFLHVGTKNLKCEHRLLTTGDWEMWEE